MSNVLGFLCSISKARGLFCAQWVFLPSFRTHGNKPDSGVMDFTEMCEREFVSEHTFQIDLPEIDLGLFDRV